VKDEREVNALTIVAHRERGVRGIVITGSAVRATGRIAMQAMIKTLTTERIENE
jgi:phosphoserine phosphatase